MEVEPLASFSDHWSM